MSRRMTSMCYGQHHLELMHYKQKRGVNFGRQRVGGELESGGEVEDIINQYTRLKRKA